MPNPVVHFEVLGEDGPGLRRFYADLFDWRLDTVEGPLDHGVVSAAQAGIGGGIGRSADGGPGRLTVYVEVADLEATLARAERLGGRRLMDPLQLPGLAGLALLADPEGHVVGIVAADRAG